MRHLLLSLAILSGLAPRLAAAESADRYIVVMKPGNATQAKQATHAQIDRLAAAHRVPVAKRFTTALRGFSASLTAAEAARLAADPDVAYVAPNVRHTLNVVRPNPTWGLDRIDQAALPLDRRFVQRGDGDGVTVFIVDSGIRATHAEVSGRVLPGATAFDDGVGSGDCNGHGTHVAGTVAGRRYGVAPRATLVPVRVYDCEGNGQTDDILWGLDFVAETAPVGSVVNYSAGGPVDRALDDAMTALVAAGVTVVVAAGNDNMNACLQSPSRAPAMITVAASSETDVRAEFSNHGSCVDIFAPGVAITSAGIASNTATETFDGTSMATPHVAGVAAAYLSLSPGARPDVVAAAIFDGATPGAIADPQGSPNRLLATMFLDADGGDSRIVAPRAGDRVPPTFEIEAEIPEQDLALVELAIDGSVVQTFAGPPYKFQARGLAAGSHMLQLRTEDGLGGTTSHSITVTVTNDGDLDGDGDLDTDGATGGCSTGGAAGLVWSLAVLGLAVRRRRR